MKTKMKRISSSKNKNATVNFEGRLFHIIGESTKSTGVYIGSPREYLNGLGNYKYKNLKGAE